MSLNKRFHICDIMFIVSSVVTRISEFTDNRKKMFIGEENQVNNPGKLVNCDMCRAHVSHEYVKGTGEARGGRTGRENVR